MKRYLIAMGVLVFYVLGVVAEEKAEPVLIEVAAVEKWLEEHPKAVVLDVRTKEEHAEGALEGAVLIPFTDADFQERVKKELKPEQPLLVYCRSGGRSAKAVKVLQEAGFKQIREIDGGVIAWGKAGKALVK
jgi:rhodanese-related sulfurtransferase